MRACEGCRRRKIKCDAATTNTWPCSACVRLKLHCVRPNGQYDDSAADAQSYEPSGSEYDTVQGPDGFRAAPMQQQSIMSAQPRPGIYGPQGTYPSSQAVYPAVSYAEPSTAHSSMQYPTMPPSAGVMDQSYAPASVFPTPPLQHQPSHPASTPGSTYPEQYVQQDLANLLGSLNVNERGTGVLGRVLAHEHRF